MKKRDREEVLGDKIYGTHNGSSILRIVYRVYRQTRNKSVTLVVEGAQAFEKSPAGCHKQCTDDTLERQTYLNGKLFDCFKCGVSSHT